jgi:propane monooxygenase small subunit
VRQVQQTVANAKAAHAFAGFSRGWAKVVERHVGAWAHAEHGIGLYVYTPAQRDAPTNMINNALAVGATHKLRLAQDLILYNLDLSENLEGFDGSAHRETWQSDPVWQGVRENVERLTGTRDWAEGFFATALVFEPLVGELFRSHFVMQVAAPQGDYVTPAVMGTGEADVVREQRGARHLFELLLSDPQHGAENRALLGEWIAKWVPVSVAAARQLQPVWSQVSEKVVGFEDSFGRATDRFRELLDGLGLESPKEL